MKKATILITVALGAAAGLAHAEMIIGGSTGNGDFEASAAASAPATHAETPHWFHASGDESMNCAHTSQTGGSSQPNSWAAMPFHNRKLVNDTGYTVSAAGQQFNLRYDFGSGGNGWDGDEAMRTFLFTTDATVDGDLREQDMKEFAEVLYQCPGDPQWSRFSKSAFYTTTAEDVGKTFYFGMNHVNPAGVPVYPRVDVVEVECVGAAVQPAVAKRSGPVERPNILLILADDLGYADVSFNVSGTPEIVTPELDKLAHAGTVFTSAYVVHPFCGPSRMGLMSGRYPHMFGAPYNLPPESSREFVDQGIPTSETMVSTVLQDAGYFTGIIGKWHLGAAPDFHPNVRGFDEFYGFLGGGKNYFGPYQAQNAAGNVWDYKTYLEHNGVDVIPTDSSEYVTDVLSREAVRFINQAATKDDPFFLFLSYNAPHTPLEAKQEDMDMFPNLSGDRKTYAGMVYAMDRGVGDVVNALKASGAFEDTLILFLSDNGGRTDQGAKNTPLRGVKGDVYEGGFRIPMLMHMPGVIAAGTKFDHPVTALDFYPTFAGLAGAAIPADKKLDGKNIWANVLAGSNPRKGDPIYAVRYNVGAGPEGLTNVGIRRDQWKAARWFGKNWQLFDVATDVGEQTDLSGQYPELLSTLVSEAEIWSRSHVAPLWNDSLEHEAKWKSRGMPHYDSTFSLP